MGKLKFLIDTNVWVELLLSQQKAREVEQFLGMIDSDDAAISEFSLYSIGIIFSRLKKDDLWRQFLRDNFEENDVGKICLNSADLLELADVKSRFNLDFDDAYQYVATKKHGLTLISFDKDFDRTDLKRKTPGDVLASQLLTNLPLTPSTL